MGHGHGHDHSTAAQAHRGRLVVVLVLTLVVLVVEVVGGIVSGSFALVADAGHMLTDAAGVGLGARCDRAGSHVPQPPPGRSGGNAPRPLAALVNGLVIGVVGVLVIVGGVRRLSPASRGADAEDRCVGLAARRRAALLRRGQGESLNVRGAYLEVLGDLLGSAAVVAAVVVA